MTSGFVYEKQAWLFVETASTRNQSATILVVVISNPGGTEKRGYQGLIGIKTAQAAV